LEIGNAQDRAAACRVVTLTDCGRNRRHGRESPGRIVIPWMAARSPEAAGLGSEIILKFVFQMLCYNRRQEPARRAGGR
jgi:hypothetical protein